MDMRCAWPGCGVEAPTIQLPDLDDLAWFCLVHADDDFLPELVTGPSGVCVKCEQQTARWAVIDGKPVPIHDGCRREWTMTNVRGERKGAYARR